MYIFWGDVGLKRWSPFLVSGSHFWHFWQWACMYPHFYKSPDVFPITPQVPTPASVEETSHCQGWDLRQKVSVSIYASPAFRPHPTLLLQPMMAHSLFLEKCFIAQLPPSSPGQEKFRWSLFDEKILGELAAASDGTDRDLLDNLIVQTLVESLLAP